MARLSGVVGLLVVSSSAHALAQSAPVTAASPSAPITATSATPPDIVVTKNGNRYRGTIAELVQGGTVTIVLITGETRKLEAKEIAYAGPANQEPAPSSAPTAKEAEADPSEEASSDDESETSQTPKVRFRANIDKAQFLYRVPGGYKPICVAPCLHEFSEGVYRFAVRRGPQDELRGARDVMVDGPTVVSAEVRSRDTLRRVGGGVATLGAIIIGSFVTYGIVADDPNKGLAIGGALAGVPAFFAGLGMAYVDDKVIITVQER